MRKLDIIFVVRMDSEESSSFNDVLFNHFKESVNNILEKGLTYHVSVHFIDFLGSHNVITFKNIYYANNDISST
jgi:predicted TPR repeat methyltransferase